MLKYKDELETKIIALLLQNIDNYDKIIGLGISSDKFEEKNKMLFDRIEKLMLQSIEINPKNLNCDSVMLSNILKIIVVDLKSVCNTWLKVNRFINVKTACNELVMSDDFANDELLNNIQESIECQEISNNKLKSIEDVESELLESIQKIIKGEKGVMSGFPNVDNLICGFQKGTLSIISARPSVGKTMLACNMLSNMDYENKGIIFSCEMSSKDVLKRIVCHRQGYEAYKLKKPQDKYFNEYAEKIKGSRLKNSIILDNARMNLNFIKAVSKNRKKTHGLDFIIIDQLSKIDYSSMGGRSKKEKFDYATGELKAFSRELEIPVILLCQINREGSDMPSMEFLKDSGAIEEDADNIIFLHRDIKKKASEIKNDSLIDIETENIDDKKGIIIIAKNRDGETGTIDCDFHLDKQIITERIK